MERRKQKEESNREKVGRVKRGDQRPKMIQSKVTKPLTQKHRRLAVVVVVLLGLVLE